MHLPLATARAVTLKTKTGATEGFFSKTGPIAALGQPSPVFGRRRTVQPRTSRKIV
jgi:hypothetical protein